MWISRVTYDRLMAQDGQIALLRQQIGAQQASNEWLMHRLTQLEHERAKLIENYMGVKIPVPEIGTPAPSEAIDQVLRDPGSLFQDVGDDMAQSLGIDWDDSGKVRYNNGK